MKPQRDADQAQAPSRAGDSRTERILRARGDHAERCGCCNFFHGRPLARGEHCDWCGRHRNSGRRWSVGLLIQGFYALVEQIRTVAVAVLSRAFEGGASVDRQDVAKTGTATVGDFQVPLQDPGTPPERSGRAR